MLCPAVVEIRLVRFAVSNRVEYMMGLSRTARRERLGRLLANTLWFAAGLALSGGCTPRPQDVLKDANGNDIRMSAIDAILMDTMLTDEEKRQALRDLGITDEQLIDALVSGGG
jgi:hypothetical protein